MSVLQSIFSEYWVEDPEDDRWWWPMGAFGRRTDSGVEVDPAKALGLAAYFACLRNISEDIAKLPLKTYRRKGRNKEEVPQHPVYRLLHDEPNPEMTAMAWRETMTHWAAGWGAGVSEIERTGAGLPAAFWPIHPTRIRLLRNEQKRLRYVIKTDDLVKSDVELPPEDVLHIHGLGGKGVTGYCLSIMASQTIGLGLQAEKFAARFFGEGIVLSGYLSHPGELKKPAKENIRQHWKTTYGGADKSHDLAILSEGMEWKQLGIPPEEAQFLETRQFEVEEVCRWFRMPPHKVQHLLRATFSNIESQNIEYVVDTLLSWATRWEQEIRRKCFDRATEADLFSEHLFNALLRGDQVKRGTFYRTMFMVGAMSQNDIRAAENENEVPHGDTYYVPANMIPAEKAITGATQKASSSGPPDGYHAAVQPIFEEAFRRLLTKESRAAQRAAEKHLPGDRIGFQNWATDFYESHREYVVKALTVPARLMAALSGDGHDVQAKVAEYATTHCAASRMDLARTDDLGAMLERWLSARPEASTRLLLEELSHGAESDASQ